MSLIEFPIVYIPDPDKGRPLFNGQVFVGKPDLDPEIPANQKQLNVIQEDGTVVAVPQPFILSAGGVPVYNGNPVRLDVEGDYSLKILNNLGAQKYYIENSRIIPTTFAFRTFEEFGAVGDGVTDDTAAFEAAKVTPGTVYGTPGANYLISAPISITTSNLNFIGNGSTITIAPTMTTTQSSGQPSRNIGLFTLRGIYNGLIESSVAIIDAVDGGSSRFPITTPSAFTQDQWIIMTTGDYSNPDGNIAFTKPQNYLGQVIGTVNSGGNDFLQFDYVLGYQIDAGTTVYYHDITPIENSSISGFTFIDESTTVIDTQWVCGVVMKYAVNCFAENITGKDMNLPLVRGLWTFDCLSKSNRTLHPRQTGGGEGYCTQWQFSHRDTSIDLSGTKCRHVNDFTCAAFGRVIGSIDTITANGSFITHGQFEHDLYYEDITGLLSFANSDVVFGESCKRITVNKARLTQFIGSNFVTDLTLNDVQVNQVGSVGNLGDVSLNTDGLVINNFITAGTVTMVQLSNLSDRQTIITNMTAPLVEARDATNPSRDLTFNYCNFGLLNAHWAGLVINGGTSVVNINNGLDLLSDIPATISNAVLTVNPTALHGNNMRGYETVLNNCTIKKFANVPISSGFITMNGGKVLNEATDLLAVMDADQRFSFNHVKIENAGFRLATEDGANGALWLQDCEITGTNSNGFLVDLDSPLTSTANISLKITGCEVNWTGTDIIFSNAFNVLNTKHDINISNSFLDGGDISLFGTGTSSGSLQFNNNTMNNLTIVVGGSGATRSLNGNTLDGAGFPLRNKTVTTPYTPISTDNGVNLVFNSSTDSVVDFTDDLNEEFEVFALNLGAGTVGVATLDTNTMRQNDALASADGISAFTKISATQWQRV